MRNKYAKRDSAIELARIMGCLIVIGVHTLLGYESDAGWDKSRLFLGMIFADGVAVFWLITGAFLYNSNSYISLIKRTIKSIVVPMFSVQLVAFYLGDWICGNSSFVNSVNHSKDDYIRILRNLIRWQNGINGLDHFWYLYVYLLLILVYPMLKAYVDYLEKDNKRIISFLIISFVLLVINDYTLNELFLFSHHSINGLVPAGVLTIWGHIIYKKRYSFKIKHSLVFVFSFVLLNLFRVNIQLSRVNVGNPNKAIMFWFSSIGFLCAICVMCLCMCIIKNDRRFVSLNYIGSCTFYIYLIHLLVKSVLERYEVNRFIVKYTCGRFHGFFGECLYSLLIIMSVFVVSLIIVVIFRAVLYLATRLFTRLKYT